MRLRLRFFILVEPSKERSDSNFYFDVFIMSLIVLNVIALIIASEPSIGVKYRRFFDDFEILSVIVFTIEYLLRIWTIVEKPAFKRPILGRVKFMFTPMAIIDLLAILPFYLPFFGIDLRFLRILRVFRVFRLLKLARYSTAFMLIKSVLNEKKEELLITLFFIINILIIVSTLMYYAERDVQPEAFSSIPKALWWGVITITTVGYGDIYPITSAGKILGGIITLLGIGLIALPSGIIASGYTEEVRKKKEKSEHLL